MSPRAHDVMVEEDDPQWVRFWDAYPRRESKKVARRVWVEMNPSPELVDKMIAALAWQVPVRRWNGENYEFAPLPATWLNQARWNDEPPPQAWRVMSESAATVFRTLGVKP